jgi:hypothetical protein
MKANKIISQFKASSSLCLTINHQLIEVSFHRLKPSVEIKLGAVQVEELIRFVDECATFKRLGKGVEIYWCNNGCSNKIDLCSGSETITLKRREMNLAFRYIMGIHGHRFTRRYIP